MDLEEIILIAQIGNVQLFKVCRQRRKTFLMLDCLFFVISFLFYFFRTLESGPKDVAP